MISSRNPAHHLLETAHRGRVELLGDLGVVGARDALDDFTQDESTGDRMIGHLVAAGVLGFRLADHSDHIVSPQRISYIP